MNEIDREKRLEEIARRHRVKLVYLFGSQVDLGLALLRGEHRPIEDPLSDIDVGVVFEEGPPSPEERPGVYASLFNELEELFSPRRLDLVFLEENHSVFQANVLDGVCLFCQDQESREAYEEEIARRAADFRPVLERFLDEILEEV